MAVNLVVGMVTIIFFAQSLAIPANFGDCLNALFQTAGLRSQQIPLYVQRFRSNGLSEDVFTGLSLVELVKLLQSKSLNITHAGDVFRLHSCVSGRGNCVLHPYCDNGGRCVFSDVTKSHTCQCTPDFTGTRCEEHSPDRLSKLEETVERLSHLTSNVGVSYTRWGKNSCNASSGSQLVYNGDIAGDLYTHVGGASNYVCLPEEPQYGAYQPGVQGQAYIFGTELETSAESNIAPYHGLHDNNPKCSVCHVPGRYAQIMIPGKNTCPPSWSREYHGYLMTAHHGHKRTEYICVDRHPDVVRGEARGTEGALLYFVEATCTNGLPCPPYVAEKELTCVVCTRWQATVNSS